MATFSIFIILCVSSLLIFRVDSSNVDKHSESDIYNKNYLNFHDAIKRNQFYGLYKKVNYDSNKGPAFINDAFSITH
uniref:Inhibitor_I29 domain-containing protein n=1 Tax=Heterorhabditis bacteriophora TaxID=37862 RepID=A0A1I7XU53_HETBA